MQNQVESPSFWSTTCLTWNGTEYCASVAAQTDGANLETDLFTWSVGSLTPIAFAFYTPSVFTSTILFDEQYQAVGTAPMGTNYLVSMDLRTPYAEGHQISPTNWHPAFSGFPAIPEGMTWAWWAEDTNGELVSCFQQPATTDCDTIVTIANP